MASFNLAGQTPQTTTLSAAITTTSATSMTVTSASGFPGSGNYDIMIDSEEITVTAGQGTTTWTITRGVNGSTAATHSNGATVRMVYNVGSTDRIWLTGALFTDNVVVGSYQDSTHVSNSSDTHTCTATHLNNTKWIADSGSASVSLNGAANSNVTALVNGNAALKWLFTDASSVATSGAKFYFYDGTTDATAMAGVTAKALQVGNSSWTGANGSGSGLTLTDQSAATAHDFFIAVSLSPSSTGAKTGKIKLLLTYV